MRNLIAILFALVFCFGFSQNKTDLLQVSKHKASGNPELHDDSNAVSIDNEANATTGWSTQSNATMTIETNVPTGGGTWSIRCTSDSGTQDRVIYSMTVESGATYAYDFWMRINTGGAGGVREWEGVVTSPNFGATDTWAQYTGTVVANATTITIKMFGARGGGTIGDWCEFDLVSFKKQ